MSKQYEREQEILSFWKANSIDKKSEAGIKKGFKKIFEKKFTFLDGPPFANGLPHFGHLLQSIIKDVIPRYKTMRGYRVPRKWGWDCHGLPVEVEIEKKLNLNSKKEIKNLGVDIFNSEAKQSVLKYTTQWKEFISKIGRSISIDDSYKTMDTEYIEGVWEVFQKIWNKGYVYKGFRISHLCTRCETILSNNEVSGGYEDVEDLAVYVAFPLVKDKKVSLVVWTTTPWTLIGNMALAINPEYDYVKVFYNNHTYIILKGKESLFEGCEIVGKIKGSELIGEKYIPLFDYITNTVGVNDSINKVYKGDFVTDDVGTGIVHIAPAYGEDDFNFAKENELPVKHHVGTDGRIMQFITEFAGKKVKQKENRKEFDIEVAKRVEELGRLVKKDPIVHSYPHCWRCNTPLLYYAQKSFFINVPKYRDKMVTENKKVNWIPKEIGEKRFNNWLENAQPWAFSRSRFWGAPIPIWVNKRDEMITLGSIEEIKNLMPPTKNTYIVMRHGKAKKNIELLNGWKLSKYDSELTDKGVAQVESKVNEIKNMGVDLIIYSPLTRTKQTAKIISEKLNIKMVEDDRFHEVGFITNDKKEYVIFKDLNGNDIKIETELMGEFIKRSTDAFYELEEKYTDKKILIVTHELVACNIIATSKGYSFEAFNDLKRFMKSLHPNKKCYINNAEVIKCDFKKLPRNKEGFIDFHRPFIDNIKLSDKYGELKRVEDVFDCWFESGCGSFASNRNFGIKNDITLEGEKIESTDGNKKKNIPVDFIGEAIDQTRGWFYSLMSVSISAFEIAPYKNVICSGIILSKDGRKMSKKLKNYNDPSIVIENYCADSVRYYLLSSPVVKAQSFNFDDAGVAEITRKIIDRLHNILQFYLLYPSKTQNPHSKNLIDRWIISRLSQLRETVTESLDNYHLDKATRPIGEFIEDLSIWYVRRCRNRMRGIGEDADSARCTLKYVLYTLSKIIAPIMPFYAEYLYQKIDPKEESVHLSEWVSGIPPADEDLIKRMQKVRVIVSNLLEFRVNAGIKVRQPLQKAILKKGIMMEDDKLLNLIKEEVNVKEIVFAEQELQATLDTNITEELRNEGISRDIIRLIQNERKEMKVNHTEKINIILYSDENTRGIVKKYESNITSVSNLKNIEYKDGELKVIIN